MNAVTQLFKRHCAAAILIGTLVAALVSTPAAHAASLPVLVVTAGPGIDVCNASELSGGDFQDVPSFKISAYLNVPTYVYIESSVSIPGQSYTYYDGLVPAILGNTPLDTYNFTPQPFGNLAPNTILTYSVSFYNGVTRDSGVAVTYSFSINCTTGLLINPPGASPFVPPTFAMKQVTCTTPVLNSPDGQSVGSAQVVAGQRWYVSLTPVKGSDGKSYTELFTGGYTDGFIPTACVNFGFNYVFGVN